jgi:hypothetical protein
MVRSACAQRCIFGSFDLQRASIYSRTGQFRRYWASYDRSRMWQLLITGTPKPYLGLLDFDRALVRHDRAGERDIALVLLPELEGQRNLPQIDSARELARARMRSHRASSSVNCTCAIGAWHNCDRETVKAERPGPTPLNRITGDWKRWHAQRGAAQRTSRTTRCWQDAGFLLRLAATSTTTTSPN